LGFRGDRSPPAPARPDPGPGRRGDDVGRLWQQRPVRAIDLDHELDGTGDVDDGRHPADHLLDRTADDVDDRTADHHHDHPTDDDHDHPTDDNHDQADDDHD
jgi:hypothetical protein